MPHHHSCHCSFSGNTYAPFELTTANYYWGATVTNVFGANQHFTSGCSASTVPCPTGSIYYHNPAMPSSSGNTHNLVVSGVAVPALGQFHFMDRYTLYSGSDKITAGGGLYKHTSASGTVSGAWVAGFAARNPSAVVAGVHGLTGRAERRAYMLYLSTSAASANAVWRYDTTFDTEPAEGAGFSLLATAAASTSYKAVLAVPIPPSFSSTRSSTASVSATASPTSSVSGSTSLTSSASRRIKDPPLVLLVPYPRSPRRP